MKIHRYTMPKSEIIDAAMWAFRQGYGSLMLQSGELHTEQRQVFVEEVIREVKRLTKAEECRQRKLAGNNESVKVQRAFSCTLCRLVPM